MAHWRWPQWAMIAILGFAFYQSVAMAYDHGKLFDLPRIGFVLGWFGVQAFVCWAGGFWSKR